MADNNDLKVEVTIAGLDRLAEQIAAQVQKAMALIRTSSMNVEAVAGKPGGASKLGDALNRLSSVFAGLASGSASGAVAGAAGGAGIMAAGGPMMTILGTIAGILEGLAPIKAIMQVISAILELVFMPLAMVLMAILMPFLLPLLQILQKFPWQQFFALTQQLSKDISYWLGEIWNGIVFAASIIQAFNLAVAGFFETLIQGFTIIYNAIVAGLGAVYTIFVSIGGTIVGLIQDVWTVLQGVWSFLTGAVGDVLNSIDNGVKGVWNAISTIYTWFTSTMQSIFQTIGDVLGAVWNVVTGVYNWFVGVMGPVFTLMGDALQVIEGAIQALVGAINNIGNVGGSISHFVGSFASGGIVPETGIAKVHAGEVVVPSGQGGASGVGGLTINVTVTGNKIDSKLDIQNLANQVAQTIANSRRKLSTW